MATTTITGQADLHLTIMEFCAKTDDIKYTFDGFNNKTDFFTNSVLNDFMTKIIQYTKDIFPIIREITRYILENGVSDKDEALRFVDSITKLRADARLASINYNERGFYRDKDFTKDFDPALDKILDFALYADEVRKICRETQTPAKDEGKIAAKIFPQWAEPLRKAKEAEFIDEKNRWKMRQNTKQNALATYFALRLLLLLREEKRKAKNGGFNWGLCNFLGFTNKDLSHPYNRAKGNFKPKGFEDIDAVFKSR